MRRVSEAAAPLLVSTIRNNIEIAKLRKYRSFSELIISDDNLDPLVFEVIESVLRDRKELFVRFDSLKKNFIGVNVLRKFDGLSQLNSVTKPIEQALENIHQSWNGVSPELAEIIILADKQNWIFTGKTKNPAPLQHNIRGNPTIHPFVKSDFTESQRSKETLAHELGHAMYTYLSRGNNYFRGFSVNGHLTEAIALFSECLLYDDRNAGGGLSGKELLQYRLLKLNYFLSLVRDVFAYHLFETKLYELIGSGQNPTGEDISNIYEKTKIEFGINSELAQDTRYEWATTQHYINHPFYLWKYTLGILIALNFEGERTRNSDSGSFGNTLIRFLCRGSTDNSRNLIKQYFNLDINDAEFWNKGLDYLENEIDKISAEMRMDTKRD